MSKYTIIKKIGSGAFGNINVLKNVITNSYSAVKKSKNFKNNKKEIVFLLNEIAIMKMMDNIFINKIKNDIVNLEEINIYLEYQSGGDLLFVFMTHFNEKLKESEALFYIAEISLGVEYIHSQNIIHRDLKLQNILISETGHIKISDFGFSCVSDKSSDYLGTVGYMAPEILKYQVYNNKVDIWAIGVIAYELVYADNPFIVDDVDKTLTMKYNTNDKFLYINDFLKNIFVNEVIRHNIDDILNCMWFKTINMYYIKNQTYNNIPYIPNKINDDNVKIVIDNYNEIIPIIVFDINDLSKCLGINIFYSLLYRKTDISILPTHIISSIKKDNDKNHLQFNNVEVNDNYVDIHIEKNDNMLIIKIYPLIL